jgi:hypothetical protein
MGVREELSTKADEVKSLKRENRKRRKVIEAYQDMLNAGATGLHRVRIHFALHAVLVCFNTCDVVFGV